MLMTVIRTGCKLKSDGISGEARMVFLEDRGNFYAKIFINGGLITVHPSTSEQADASETMRQTWLLLKRLVLTGPTG